MLNVGVVMVEPPKERCTVGMGIGIGSNFSSFKHTLLYPQDFSYSNVIPFIYVHRT